MNPVALSRVEVPVRRLLAHAPDEDPVVERMRAVVCATAPTLTLLRVADRDVRRFDLWVGGAGIVVVPYREDHDAPVPCAHGTGASATLLFAELLANGVETTPASDSSPLRFAEVGELVRVVAEGDDRFRGATVLHSQAEDVDLVRLWGQRSSWGSAPSGEPIEAADAGDAAYWGLALSMLRGGTLVGPSGPDT